MDLLPLSVLQVQLLLCRVNRKDREDREDRNTMSNGEGKNENTEVYYK